MENSQSDPAVSGVVISTSHVRRLAVAAYLAQFKGQSRIHTESDLRGYLTWCEARGLDPLAATRPHRALPPLAPRGPPLRPGVKLPRMHPHMLRHTFVTTILDAGVDLRDVQIAARHADPRTTMRYDRARKNLDRHPNYILAAYMASGT